MKQNNPELTSDEKKRERKRKAKEYYLANREKIKAYYQLPENKAKQAEYCRQWRAKMGIKVRREPIHPFIKKEWLDCQIKLGELTILTNDLTTQHIYPLIREGYLFMILDSYLNSLGNREPKF